MEDFILFMHNDASDCTIANDDALWGKYLGQLKDSGRFDGGSAIGAGLCMNRRGLSKLPHDEITGFIRVRAESLEDAQQFVHGNPVYEAGGTVEIRHLPRDD